MVIGAFTFNRSIPVCFTVLLGRSDVADARTVLRLRSIDVVADSADPTAFRLRPDVSVCTTEWLMWLIDIEVCNRRCNKRFHNMITNA